MVLNSAGNTINKISAVNISKYLTGKFEQWSKDNYPVQLR